MRGGAAQFYRGYVFDTVTRQLGRVALKSPPFYSIRFERDEIDCGLTADALLGDHGHSAVRERLAPVPLPDARFCILRHGMNSGGDIAGQPVTDPIAREEILARFGIEDEATTFVLQPPV